MCPVGRHTGDAHMCPAFQSIVHQTSTACTLRPTYTTDRNLRLKEAPGAMPPLVCPAPTSDTTRTLSQAASCLITSCHALQAASCLITSCHALHANQLSRHEPAKQVMRSAAMRSAATPQRRNAAISGKGPRNRPCAPQNHSTCG